MSSAVVVGEAFVDLIAHRDPTGALAYVPRFGGSPLNVAVGMRRLGAEVRLATTTADDAFGRQVSAFFAAEGVDATTLSSRVPRTVVSVATPADGHVSYEYLGDVASLMQIHFLPVEAVRSAKVLHASSTAFNGDPALTTVHEAYRACEGFRTMDPNPRPALVHDVAAYRQRLEAVLADVDLLKVSREDLEFIYTGQDATSTAHELHQRFDVPVVVTQASEPTLLVVGGSVHHVAVPEIEVIDATGAGDSFMACLLAQVWRGSAPAAVEDWVALVRLANQAAAITCRGMGGAESMPRESDLDALLHPAP